MVRLAPGMVRGLDYYCRTAFEITGEGQGAQDAIGGGGRYDGLVSSLGRKSRADLCIAYARGLSFVTHVLIGMRSVEQLHENLSLFEDCAPLTAEEVAADVQLPPRAAAVAGA